MATIPLSLYIHFPWCLHKCPYCDFNSYRLSDNNLIAIYVKKLIEDLKIEAEKQNGGKLKSIYFGGGTPSLLSPKLIAAILQRVSNHFSFTDKIEITLEANPGTIDVNLCRKFKAAGVNRISLGIQSFADTKLKKIKRIHNAEEAKAAIYAVTSSGITNFNLDLMYGLPEQDVANALQDLTLALEFQPSHLSWYQLTLEPEVASQTDSWLLPGDEELWRIQQAGHDFLLAEGWQQYEVAAYCQRANLRCKHNINYWQYGDYLGIGAGAHSKITKHNYLITRYWKHANPMVYLKAKKFVAGKETIAKEKIPLEFMLNHLRLYQPLRYKFFRRRTGLPIDAIKKQLRIAAKLGLISCQNKAIITTSRGKRFLNDLLEIFL